MPGQLSDPSKNVNNLRLERVKGILLLKRVVQVSSQGYSLALSERGSRISRPIERNTVP